MRALALTALLACVSVTYAMPNIHHDPHRPGYYFVKHHGIYYPDYQYPRFDFYWYNHDRLCHDRDLHNRTGLHGMVRCYNHEGLNIEYYLR